MEHFSTDSRTISFFFFKLLLTSHVHYQHVFGNSSENKLYGFSRPWQRTRRMNLCNHLRGTIWQENLMKRNGDLVCKHPHLLPRRKVNNKGTTLTLVQEYWRLEMPLNIGDRLYTSGSETAGSQVVSSHDESPDFQVFHHKVLRSWENGIVEGLALPATTMVEIPIQPEADRTPRERERRRNGGGVERTWQSFMNITGWGEVMLQPSDIKEGCGKCGKKDLLMLSWLLPFESWLWGWLWKHCKQLDNMWGITPIVVQSLFKFAPITFSWY